MNRELIISNFVASLECLPEEANVECDLAGYALDIGVAIELVDRLAAEARRLGYEVQVNHDLAAYASHLHIKLKCKNSSTVPKFLPEDSTSSVQTPDTGS